MRFGGKLLFRGKFSLGRLNSYLLAASLFQTIAGLFSGTILYAEEITSYDLKLKEGKALMERLAYPEAIKSLEEALKLEPSRPEAYYYLAAIYERKGLYDQAIPFWERRCQISPQNKEGREAREHFIFLNIIKERDNFLKSVTLPEKLEKMHFIIYHQNYLYASGLVFKAESAYKKIRHDLGVINFPFWDRFKCALLLFPNKEAYVNFTSAPDWSGGIAQYGRFFLAAFEGSPGLEEKTLPHELSHLALQMFMGSEANIPLWLNEGLAKYEEGGPKDYLRLMKDNLGQGRFYPLPTLFNMTQYPEDVPLFYAQSASLIYYLKEQNISSLFAQLLEKIKNGTDINACLKEVYQRKFYKGAVDLEEKWKKELD